MSTSMKTVLLVCPILLSFACSEKKKFGGDVAAAKIPAAGDATPAEETATEPTESTTETPAVIPSSCGVNQGEITKVTLLSTGINLAISNQSLKYELSVVNCKDGSIVPIKDQTLSFDLNLTSLNGFKDIAYTVVDASTSKSIASGNLDTVEGSDLFGNKGEYAHWVTKSLSYSTATSKVILEINLKNIRLKSKSYSDTEAESYLQVGNAAAVTQKLNIIAQ